MTRPSEMLVTFIVVYALIPYLLDKMARWLGKRSRDRESKKQMWEALTRQSRSASPSGNSGATYNPPPRRP